MYPERIVCLTEETTETLYLLGEQDRIVGISGFTVRPPRARKEKPKVSAFTSANIDAILAAALIRHGVPVYVFNQRSVAQILSMIAQLGGLIGAEQKATRLIAELQQNISVAQEAAAKLPRRPRVFFEEWYDPLISGIGWVSELVGIAGGDDIFPELAREPGAKQRIIADPLHVVERMPDIVIGSWCGRKFKPEKVLARDGWGGVPAVVNQHVYEVKSPLILQPGPAALSDGLAELQRIVLRWSATQ